MQRSGRRRFLGLALGGGAAALLARYRLPGRSALSAPVAWSRESWALGAAVRMTVLTPDETQAQRGLDAAFAALERVEAVMSLYRDNSQLRQLNERGRVSSPDPWLVEILAAARTVSEHSQGAFDVTVQPLWELSASAHRQGVAVADDARRRARALVDWRNVRATRHEVRLAAPGMAVTLNGIAQGFAADQAAAALRAHGIRAALIDTGELQALGGKSFDEDWRVGIQHPRESSAWSTLAGLRDRSLATSGDYATAFGPDFRDHHIFDPRTGRSPDELSSVSVAATSAMLADALSTAFLATGSRRGLAMLSKFSNCDAMWIHKDGSQRQTPGFPADSS